MSDGSPKLIAIDEEPNHQVMPALCLGKTARPAYQALDPRAQVAGLALALLRLCLPHCLVADYNAWLLLEVSITLLGQAVAQAVFPRLAAHGDASDWQSLRRNTTVEN
jgi:hypothetical protein